MLQHGFPKTTDDVRNNAYSFVEQRSVKITLLLTEIFLFAQSEGIFIARVRKNITDYFELMTKVIGVKYIFNKASAIFNMESVYCWTIVQGR